MNEFTLKEYVDEQVIRLEQRDEFEAKVNDIRLNEIKAVVEKAVTEMRRDNDNLRLEIRGELKNINTRINALDKRIDDLKDAQSHNLAYWGIAVALFVGAVQVVVSRVLNFWK